MLKNNWYDGPFDQMPDNYIYLGKIPEYKEYIEATYPGVKGKIDKFGNYLENDGVRVAVGPYYVYFSTDDLSFVRSCKSQNITTSQFYFCLTQQVYNLPENLTFFEYTWLPE